MAKGPDPPRRKCSCGCSIKPETSYDRFNVEIQVATETAVLVVVGVVLVVVGVGLISAPFSFRPAQSPPPNPCTDGSHCAAGRSGQGGDGWVIIQGGDGWVII